MKIYFSLIAVLLGGAAWAATADKETSAPLSAVVSVPSLQVMVNPPIALRPWVADDVAEAFGSQIVESLRRQGYAGIVTLLDRTDPFAKDALRLDIELIEWRRDRVGNLECTFTAALTTPAGRKSLGLFTGTALTMGRARSWFDLANQYEDAAHDAADGLLRRIRESGLLAQPEAA